VKGKFSNASGSSFCMDCAAGYDTNDVGNATQCLPCSIGKFAGAAQGLCTPCSPDRSTRFTASTAETGAACASILRGVFITCAVWLKAVSPSVTDAMVAACVLEQDSCGCFCTFFVLFFISICLRLDATPSCLVLFGGMLQSCRLFPIFDRWSCYVSHDISPRINTCSSCPQPVWSSVEREDMGQAALQTRLLWGSARCVLLGTSLL
jgi:hypothetical protein